MQAHAETIISGMFEYIHFLASTEGVRGSPN